MERKRKLRRGRFIRTVIVVLIAVFLTGLTAFAAPTVTPKKIGNGIIIHLRLRKTEVFPKKPKDSDLFPTRKQMKKGVRFKSSNPSIVAVNKNGYIKGLKVGKTTVKIIDKKTKKTLKKYSVRVFDTSPSAVYTRLVSLKRKYPQGSRFDDYYPYSFDRPYVANLSVPCRGDWFCGSYYACAAFAAELSDYAYGSIKGKPYYDYRKIAPGDTVVMGGSLPDGSRWWNRGHQAIVLRVSGDRIYLAEANINSRVMWDTVLTKNQMKSLFIAGMTRNG